MPTCLSITKILWHIYSIVDRNLYAIYEEMLTLDELQRIQKKCEEQPNEKIMQYELLLEVSL